MKIKEINEAAKALIGGNYDSYGSVADLRNIFQKQLEASLPDNCRLSMESDSRGNADFYICKYAEGRTVKELIARGRVTKTKTKTHRAWYGSYCDWAIKDAAVKFYDDVETIEEAAGLAATRLNNQIKTIRAAKNKTLTSIKNVLDKTGLSYRELATLARYIKDHEWSLESELEELGGTN